MVEKTNWVTTKSGAERAMRRIAEKVYQLEPTVEKAAEPTLYTMTYTNNKGKTKQLAFAEGVKHKNIVVSDMDTAQAYAQAQTQAWGVTLVEVTSNSLEDTLTELSTDGLSQ